MHAMPVSQHEFRGNQSTEDRTLLRAADEIFLYSLYFFSQPVTLSPPRPPHTTYATLCDISFQMAALLSRPCSF